MIITYQETNLQNLHLYMWQILHYIAFLKTNSIRYKCANCVSHLAVVYKHTRRFQLMSIVEICDYEHDVTSKYFLILITYM